MHKPSSSTDTYSYKGWLISDNFLKRSFAVYLHNLVARLIVGFGMFVLFLVIALVLYLIGASLPGDFY